MSCAGWQPFVWPSVISRRHRRADFRQSTARAVGVCEAPNALSFPKKKKKRRNLAPKIRAGLSRSKPSSVCGPTPLQSIVRNRTSHIFVNLFYFDFAGPDNVASRPSAHVPMEFLTDLQYGSLPMGWKIYTQKPKSEFSKR